MGNIRGTKHPYAKDTTEEYLSIDVRHWKRSGLLQPEQSFIWQWEQNGKVVHSVKVTACEDRVLIFPPHNSNSQKEERLCTVPLTTTNCHLGGRRQWFLCPEPECGRRVAVLYGPDTFACRICRDLTYSSQRESAEDRAIRQRKRIQQKLEWSPNNDIKGCVKPKGLHRETFEKLTSQHDALTLISQIQKAIKMRP